MDPATIRRFGLLAGLSVVIVILKTCSNSGPSGEQLPSFSPTPNDTSILAEPLLSAPPGFAEDSPSPTASPSPSPTPVRAATPDPMNLITGYQDFCLGEHMGVPAYIKKSERDNPSNKHHVWFELRLVDSSDDDYQNVDGGLQIKSSDFPHWMEVPSGAGPNDERIRIQTAVDYRSPSKYFDRSAGRVITPEYLTVDGRMQERPDFEKLVNTFNLYWRNWLDNKC